MSEKVTGKAFDFKIFRRILTFAKQYRSAFILASFAAIFLSAFAVTRPMLTKIAVDDFISVKDAQGLLQIMYLMVVILFFEVAFQFTFIYTANWIGQNIIKDIRVKLFTHIQYFSRSYFDTSSIGKMVTRVVSDIETIARFFGQGLFMIISDILKMFVIASFMLYLSWQLALITFVILSILIYATKLFQIAIKSSFQQVRTHVSQLNSFIQERITGMKIVQLFHREKLEYDKFVSINNKHKKAWIKSIWYYSVFFPVAEVLQSIAVGLLVWYGVFKAIDSPDVSIGEIFFFIQAAQMLFRPLRQIADKFNTLQMGMVAAERIFTVLDTDSRIDNQGSIVKNGLDGSVRFDKVRFSYIPGEEILKGISFSIEKGQTIAIVGATGAGKSTIINLVNRFYTIDSGTIRIDGVLVQDYELSFLRSQIAVVLQDVFLFSDTIYNNIVLQRKDISIEEVEEAAKIIGIHNFISSLPGGYQYNVKERGVMLSSGQRQLIAFLRAYINKPTILILDEATSSVDSESEQLIQKATDNITKNQTSIIIAHRLATIKNADKIMVMDKGEIKEFGNHETLLNVEGGYYKNLYEMQFLKENTFNDK